MATRLDGFKLGANSNDISEYIASFIESILDDDGYESREECDKVIKSAIDDYFIEAADEAKIVFAYGAADPEDFYSNDFEDFYDDVVSKMDVDPDDYIRGDLKIAWTCPDPYRYKDSFSPNDEENIVDPVEYFGATVLYNRGIDFGEFDSEYDDSYSYVVENIPRKKAIGYAEEIVATLQMFSDLPVEDISVDFDGDTLDLI